MTDFTYEEAFGGVSSNTPSLPTVTVKAKAPAGTKPISSKPSNEFSFEDAFGLPAEPEYKPRSEASIVAGGIAAGGRAVANEVATLGDMILNTPTSIVGVGANILRRLGGVSKGEDRKEGAKAGRELQEKIEATAPNLLKKFVNFVPLPGEKTGSPTHVEKAMGALLEWSDIDAQAAEDRSKGAIKKEDVQLLRDTALNFLGMKGITIPTKALVDAQGKKKLNEMQSPIPELESAPPVVSAVDPSGQMRAIEQSTGVAPVSARTSKQALAQKRADVRAAFEQDPGYANYMRNLVDENVRQSDLAANRPARTQAAEGVMSPRQSSDATILGRDGTPDTTVMGQRSLDTGLEKVIQGRSFELTAAEKVAIRGNAKAWGGMIEKGAASPDLLAAMGIAGVGTMLAMAYPDEAKDLVAAVAAGGLFFSGNLRDIGKMSEASPMSALLKNSDTTLKTLERLPQNHSVYKKSLVEEQLKRQDVTKAEKDVIEAVLRDVPGDTITPKQLVTGFKKETGNWELTKQVTDKYADYGLENIGRDPWTEKLPTNEQARRAREETALDAIEMESAPDFTGKTHVYQLPEHMMMDQSNHFNDPRYFGHTRSFMEGDIRHVVEIQSDLAQHAGKRLEGEAFNKALEEANKLYQQKAFYDEAYLRGAEKPADYVNILKDLVDKFKVVDPEFKTRFGVDLAALGEGRQISTSRGADFFDDFIDNAEKNYYTDLHTTSVITAVLEKDARRVALRAQELQIKIDSTAIDSQLSPILKNWPKRLIREELADAAGRGEAYVRFPTADVVAKVEGWPDLQENFDRSWGRNPAHTERWSVNHPAQRFTKEHQGIYDRYDKEVTKFLKQLGAVEVTDGLGYKWLQVETTPGMQRKQMFGGVKQDVLTSMGAAGAGAVVGAYLAGKEDVTGAVLGAAGGLLGRYGASKSGRVRKAAAELARGADYAGGLVSTRVKNISESVHHKLVEHERQIFREGHKDLTVVAPFIESLGKVKGDLRKELDVAILTNDPVAIRNAMAKARIPGLTQQWGTVRKLLDDLGQDSLDTGLLKTLRKDYYPRIVKDVDGLLAKLDLEQRTFLEQKLARAEAQAQKTTGQPLSSEARSSIINADLADGSPGGPGKASFRKKRSIQEVTKELLPFYETPVDALTGYIRSAAREQAKARFFGKNAVKDPEGMLDMEASIGSVVEKELTAGKIDFKQVDELKGLLRSRFIGGDRSSAAAVQDIKNLGYTSLLGHPTSALVQLSDVGQTVFTQGLIPTVEGVVQLMRGKGVSAKDFGLMDHVAEELASTRGTAKLLNNTLKLVGFSAIDRFGKSSAITAAKIKYERLAQTEKGQAEIVKKYDEAFGNDTAQLVQDLKAKKGSDLVDSLLFHELSRQQPISKIEVPQAYLDNPNARAVYMLKTFMLKQIDLARRDGYNEIKKGNVTKGVRNLMGLGLLWGVSGATNGWVRDFILGKEVDPQLDDVWKSMFKTFGWSDYVFEKAEQGKPIQAALGTIMPPIGIVDDSLMTAQKAMGDKVKKPSDLKGVSNIPVAGRLVYNRMLGGAEDSEKKRKLRERRRERQRRKEARGY